MTAERKPELELIDRFLAGMETREDEALLSQARDTGAPTEAEIARARVAIRDAMRSEVRGRSVAKGSPVTKWLGYSIAAAIIVVGFISVKPAFLKIITPQSKTYVTAIGQSATIQLDDGSRVVLAPATTIHVTGRSVDLSGEAAFTVAQRSREAFTVKTANAITRVLGTTFVVRQYAEDPSARIAVSDGRVSVNAAVLNAGDMAISMNGAPTITHNADVTAAMSWTTGNLRFDKTPLSEVLPELARWYGVELVAADPRLLNRRLTATLSTSSLTPAVLELITNSLDVRYARVGRIVTLYPGR